MINILKLDFLINDLCWIYEKGQADFILACSDKESPEIKIYNGKGSSDPLVTIKTLHKQPVNIIRYNSEYQVVVSVDEGGMIEYWEPSRFDETEEDSSAVDPGFIVPQQGKLSWELKSDTDLYDFKKVYSILVNCI
jgi:peptidylprolyl isomerase domain and WD repeat-containing protein 1